MVNRDYVRAPLIEALARHMKKEYLAFHMPGHKGGPGAAIDWQQLVGLQALALDLTELEGLDDLHYPTGPIKEAQELAATLMGGRAAFFLVNGVSSGIHAAILSLCREGEKIILPRHAHRSIFGAVALSGAQPVYLRPSVDHVRGIPVGIEPVEVDRVLSRHSDARCLAVVHPTYHGFTSDLAGIVKKAKKCNVQVLADEAHGAHFKFSSRFPVTALECGAAVTVQGWHKTMGSLTQSALLLVRESIPEIRNYLTVLQSTSPSYLLMASLDGARRNWAVRGGALAEEILELANYFREQTRQLKGIVCLDRESINCQALKDIDRTKLVLDAISLGLDGFQLAGELRRYRIQPEMAEFGGVTLMLTVGDGKEKVDALLKALQDISVRYREQKKRPVESFYDLPVTEMKMLPGEALKARKRALKAKQAAGQIAGEFICPYPPGIPVVVPGEVISREVLDIIERIRRMGGRVQGPADATGETLKVIDG